jgi:large subunit ribosomal protein L29
MKVDELRVLEEDELGTRLKSARRELYELRFKHAVGQLENASQIAKVRHDIARIMTVLNERELGISSIQEATEPIAVATPTRKTAADEGFIDEPETEPEPAVEAEPEAAPVAAVEEAPKPKRAPRKGGAPGTGSASPRASRGEAPLNKTAGKKDS